MDIREVFKYDFDEISFDKTCLEFNITSENVLSHKSNNFNLFIICYIVYCLCWIPFGPIIESQIIDAK